MKPVRLRSVHHFSNNNGNPYNVAEVGFLPTKATVFYFNCGLMLLLMSILSKVSPGGFSLAGFWSSSCHVQWVHSQGVIWIDFNFWSRLYIGRGHWKAAYPRWRKLNPRVWLSETTALDEWQWLIRAGHTVLGYILLLSMIYASEC